MINKIRALIVGCGNIGALYDFKKEGIRTHAKAFAQKINFETSVFDSNIELAAEIAGFYQFNQLVTLENIKANTFDIVVISTPTSTHFEILKRMLELQIPVIICEKPIADSIEELEQLHQLKTNSRSRVLVNYFRRFHPKYHELKDWIGGCDEQIKNIQISYQRGFLNNATHGLDLLNFLLGDHNLEQVHIGHYAFDEFKKDPTLSLTALFGHIPIIIQGLEYVHLSFFEIKLWFTTIMISIENSGQSISVFQADANREFSFYLPLTPVSTPFDNVNAIENAMKFLADRAELFLNDPRMEDNFETSYNMNKQSLKIIESICPN